LSPSPSGELLALAGRVQLVIFDVDGVLTDGSLLYGPQGEALKRFHVRDGHGIVLARLTGLGVAILSARRSAAVAFRAEELGLLAVEQGCKDKGAGLEALLARLGVRAEACAYMGDDLNDLAPLARVGLPACPADAAPEVQERSRFISSRPGGQGAARELLELVLQATGRWGQALELMKAGKS
jgi:3-deoxy-D-manno-octulosonate 8-phosphate phosphatase (KDO 8-P phosphatase)